MSNQIKKINEDKDVNTISIVCSTLNTGYSSKYIVQQDYPLDLSIESIENKFSDRFDDPSYYYSVSGSSPSLTSFPLPTPGGDSVTPTPTATSTVTPTPSVTISSTPSITATPTPTPSASASSINRLTTNSANFGYCADWNDRDGNVTTVGTNGRSSAYNIYDLNGNVWEWTSVTLNTYKKLRGGAYSSAVTSLSRSNNGQQYIYAELAILGFRCVTLTNPYNYGGFISVGDAGNNGDTLTNFGSISYEFQILQDLVTNNDYINFLNAIATTDTYNAYCAEMTDNDRGGIIRSGSNGNYSYTTKTNMGNKPVNFVNWYNAARYCNWLHNNKPSGTQSSATTENGAYLLNGNSGFPNKTIDAKYYIPSDDEWFKSAYYKSGNTDAGYWNYATQSDSNPQCVSATSTGEGIIL